MAGFKYNLTPEKELEERYDVQTGINRRGPFVLNTEKLPVGTKLPKFAPICADMKHHTCELVRNMTVFEAYANGTTDLAIKVAKGSFPYAGMFIGKTGKGGAKVTAVDTSNADYDVLTIEAVFGATLAVGDVIYEATAVGGNTQKFIANSALYALDNANNMNMIDSEITNCALLRTAAEIEPSKLAIPFSANDKANLQGWFQFNE